MSYCHFLLELDSAGYALRPRSNRDDAPLIKGISDIDGLETDEDTSVLAFAAF